MRCVRPSLLATTSSAEMAAEVEMVAEGAVGVAVGC